MPTARTKTRSQLWNLKTNRDMSDANNPNIPPSQLNCSSADGDCQENWNNLLADEDLEQQFFSLIELANSDDCEQQQPLEEQLFSLLEATSATTESEIVALEASLIDFENNDERSQDDTNWFEKAYQLEEQNQELQQALEAAQGQLNEQIERSQNAETTIAQQAQELHRLQDQIVHLVARLEGSEQEVQRQQPIVSTLSQQLEIAQLQIAQLEREYALLQEDRDDKTQKLAMTEKHLQELWTRLHRQQRYALEYKAALEQCLNPSNGSSELPLSPNITVIEPWSSDRNLFPDGVENNANAIDPSLERSFIMEVDASEVLETSETQWEFEPDSSSQIVTTHSSNWPAPIISTQQKSQIQVKVDLPSFLPTRHSRA